MTEDADLILVATTKIVTAWLGSHEIAAAAVSDLIRAVHASLTYQEPELPVADRMMPAKPEYQTAPPAVDIRRSVFADYLICLEDGKPFRTLKRHLGEAHRMTPEDYRAKWDLPESYPMIAPDYAKERSRISKGRRLGKRKR